LIDQPLNMLAPPFQRFAFLIDIRVPIVDGSDAGDDTRFELLPDLWTDIRVV